MQIGSADHAALGWIRVVGPGVQYGRTSKVRQPDGVPGRSNLFVGELGLSTAATPRDGRSDDGVRRPGQREDAALFGRLNGARLGRILFECEMGARAVVIEEVAAQTTEVSLLEDNYVVKQF